MIDSIDTSIKNRFYDRSYKQRRMWCLISMRQDRRNESKMSYLSSFFFEYILEQTFVIRKYRV